MKYVNMGVVFQEVPDEVTLSINISNCPCHCIGCHSQYLWEDIGDTLDTEVIDSLMEKYSRDITCVCFMGGDASAEEVNALARFVKDNYPKIKVAWYSGKPEISEMIELMNFDFIKIGPYIENLGGLNKRTTNQRMYRITEDMKLDDITSKFWKN